VIARCSAAIGGLRTPGQKVEHARHPVVAFMIGPMPGHNKRFAPLW
jgi:hypothetical protein